MNAVVITRRSPFTNKENSMTFAMSNDEYSERYFRWQKGELIQEAFDNLNADEREFIMTGITPAEWDKFIPEE